MPRNSFEDPLSWFARIINKVHSLWLSWTYPFSSVGIRLAVHHSVEVSRATARLIRLGNFVSIGRDAWLNVPEGDHTDPVLILDDGCTIGRRNVLSAKNLIHIERHVVFGPSVLVMDHNHSFEDVTTPIALQGITEGGTIRIEEGCWIGFGSAIVCGKGELVIGKNSVIGANSVVTRSIPPYSVVTGNPARVVKQFDISHGKWVLGSATMTTQAGAKC